MSQKVGTADLLNEKVARLSDKSVKQPSGHNEPPPNNKLEALKKDRLEPHSIRINAQWRLCFAWAANGPEDVEICDWY